MKKIDFPFKENDVVTFPDTDTEFVDVEIGYIPVSRQHFFNCLRVVKKGKGLSLMFLDKPIYTEAFKCKRIGKNKDMISIQQYLDYFGDFKEMNFICKYEDFKS